MPPGVPAVLLLVLAASLAGCIQDAAPKAAEALPTPPLGDPLAMGPHAPLRAAWDLGDRVVEGSDGTYLVRTHGSVHVPDGGGTHPVVLLVHGRHNTCDTGLDGERNLRPCPDAPPLTRPIRSHTGYDWLAEHLAGHGIVALSLDVNHVGDHDNQMGFALGDDYGATARARVVLDVLAELREAHRGDGEGGLEALEGRLDLSRVGLWGHSRGGEGVVRAWELARDEDALAEDTRLRAVFTVGPSDFFLQDAGGVPFAVLLPYCDGDSPHLPGAGLYDRARSENPAPIHQFLVLGANHNHYNTVWSEDDWEYEDRDDDWCDAHSPTTGRDDPEAQRRGGTALASAFLRAHLLGESGLLPFLNGEHPWPVPGVVTSHHPPRATPALHRDGHDWRGDVPTTTGGVRATRCTGADCPAHDTRSPAAQTALRWDGPGTYAFHVTPTTGTLTFRVGVDPATVTPEELRGVRVAFRTLDDRSAAPPVDLAALGAFVPPGQDAAKTVLNTVRVTVPPDAARLVLEFGGGDGVVQVEDWLYA